MTGAVSYLIDYWAEDDKFASDGHPDSFDTRAEAEAEAPVFMAHLPWAVRWTIRREVNIDLTVSVTVNIIIHDREKVIAAAKRYLNEMDEGFDDDLGFVDAIEALIVPAVTPLDAGFEIVSRKTDL